MESGPGSRPKSCCTEIPAHLLSFVHINSSNSNQQKILHNFLDYTLSIYLVSPVKFSLIRVVEKLWIFGQWIWLETQTSGPLYLPSYSLFVFPFFLHYKQILKFGKGPKSCSIEIPECLLSCFVCINLRNYRHKFVFFFLEYPPCI